MILFEFLFVLVFVFKVQVPKRWVVAQKLAKLDVLGMRLNKIAHLISNFAQLFIFLLKHQRDV